MILYHKEHKLNAAGKESVNVQENTKDPAKENEIEKGNVKDQEIVSDKVEVVKPHKKRLQCVEVDKCELDFYFFIFSMKFINKFKSNHSKSYKIN